MSRFPPLSLPITPPHPPMEAKTVPKIPKGEWRYEPKWDGFRCLVFADGDQVVLQSKACKPLGRYFPELVEAVRALPADRFVLDGEIVIPVADGFSFDDLLLRIHPAASRIAKLSREIPACLLVFDLLVDEGEAIADQPLDARRVRLEAFARRVFPTGGRFALSPSTTDRDEAERWYRNIGREQSDGVVAKRRELPYRAGERDGMQKIKRLRTADCVVGGFRYGTDSPLVGSLLLGLYDEEGLLHHVGFASNIPSGEKEAWTRRVEALRGGAGFTGRAPGGPSRWATERSTEWEPLRPELVVEVRYDHFTQGRFRHGTKLLRRRPDKAPDQCTFEQVREGRLAAV